MGLLISADVARVLAVTLDGRELARYYVAEQVDDVEVLEELGQVLGDDRTAPDDMALDPGPLDEPAASAEPEPAPPPDVEPDSARQTIKSPQVTTTVPDPDEHPAPPPAKPGPAPAAPAKEPWRPGTVSRGEAERGKATDAVVRRWARDEGLADPGARVQLPAWVRVEYERLRGGPPDFRARRIAREHGTPATTPDVDPGVASLQTIHVWCLRNGVEDRLPPSTDAKTAYRAAWIAAHPKPPAAGSAAGEDPPTPGERAGRSPARASGRSNGTRLSDFPSDSSSDDGTHYAGDGCDPPHPSPDVEPIGDGTAKKRSRARPEQLERARELAAESKTPVQICDLTGVSLDEAREAVADAKKDQKR